MSLVQKALADSNVGRAKSLLKQYENPGDDTHDVRGWEWRYLKAQTLSDEHAMSQSNSPFRNVQSLTDYIATLINESK